MFDFDSDQQNEDIDDYLTFVLLFGGPEVGAPYATQIVSRSDLNAYFFTGRRLDQLAAGGPGMYHYRRRAYDPVHGRFLQRDSVGYVDGMSLYEYARGNPPIFFDPDGTHCCGVEIGKHLRMIAEKMTSKFRSVSAERKRKVCHNMVDSSGWDIFELAWRKELFSNFACGADRCRETVQVDGKCYRPAEVNYFLWGLGNRLCHDAHISKLLHREVDGVLILEIKYYYTLSGAIGKIKQHRVVRYAGTGIRGRVAWAKAGWHGRFSAPRAELEKCHSLKCWRCPFTYRGRLWAYLGRSTMDLSDKIEVSAHIR